MVLYFLFIFNIIIVFFYYCFFVQVCSICIGFNMLICVLVGMMYFFIFVGCVDGLVFVCNVLQKLFKQKGELLRKFKIFEYEYRLVVVIWSSQGNFICGVVWIFQGYLFEVNDDL